MGYRYTGVSHTFPSQKTKELRDIRQKLSFGFMYYWFKEQRFYCEFFIFYRKVILIALSVFLSNHSLNAQSLTVTLTILSIGHTLKR
jgi:hypothetical protein